MLTALQHITDVAVGESKKVGDCKVCIALWEHALPLPRSSSNTLGRGYPVGVRRGLYLMLRLPPSHLSPPQGDSTLWERNELIVRYAELHEIQCSAVRDSIYSQTCAWRRHCVRAGLKCRRPRAAAQD